MKIVALDFETANESPLSACSLGVSSYKDGEFIENKVMMICPPPAYRRFIFTYIHHLTLDDVIAAPDFAYYYRELCELFKEAILVAHNARFDLGVLNSLCDYYDLERFHNLYLDTVKIARIIYPFLDNHKLNTVSSYLDIELDHHEAKSDSMACLLILIKAMEDVNCYEIEDFLKQIHLKPSYNR